MIRRKIACWNRLSPIRIPSIYPTLDAALKVIDYPCTLIVDELTPTRLDGGDYRHIIITADKPLKAHGRHWLRLVGCKSPLIRGITIDATEVQEAFVAENQADLQIEDVTITGSQRAAVEVRTASRLVATNLRAHGCAAAGSASKRYSAINIHRASTASIKTLEINGSGWNGLQAAAGAVVHVRGATVRDCVSYGIRATNGATVNAESCTVRDCQRAGIYSSYGSSINARACTVGGTGPRIGGLPNAGNSANLLSFGGLIYAGEGFRSDPIHGSAVGVRAMSGGRISVVGATLVGSGGVLRADKADIWR